MKERVRGAFTDFGGTITSAEMKGSYKTVSLGLYAMSRWTLAVVIHPIHI